MKPQEKIEKLKEGCGEYSPHEYTCGVKIGLCPVCQAKLSGYEEGLKDAREEVLEIIDRWTFEKGIYEEPQLVNVPDLEELKQAVGEGK